MIHLIKGEPNYVYFNFGKKTMPASPYYSCNGYLCLSWEIYLAAYRRIAAFRAVCALLPK